MELTEELRRLGVNALPWDLTRQDWAAAVANAFRFTGVALLASSYNGGVFTPMAQFLERLRVTGYQGRTVGLVENGSWGPTAARTMQAVLDQMHDLTILEPKVTIRSTLNDTTRAQLKELAAAFAAHTSLD
jgi:flavorubredoxin